MYGIFMEAWVIFKQYGGNGYLLVLFLASMLYLLIAEKDMRKKLVMAVAPLIVLVGFFIPVTRIAYVAKIPDGGDTYYRILWLIPMSAIIAYAGCKLFMEHKRIGLVVVSALIILSGSLVYKNEYVKDAENVYHIPQVVIDVCDEISPEEGEPRVRAVFPEEFIHFVRQYDTNILMPYGRDVIHNDYYNAVYVAFQKPEVINAEELLEATRQAQCNYIVMYKDRQIDVKLEDMGLELVNMVGGYNIYKDPEIAQ
ncbi:hypothetical protein [Butyrivibrio sp. INlla16]|uniref:hypothetical protein n=1 Tax=Butyrivibrio sp. INlla16 TaxID=1520807 RepID=UPI0008917AF6|nr:hypothetical protein [Butyrivibrio sp. INlla16]SDB46825.1 hypothetical protein SAMN02910263_02305 [Butyrivibrio sp. INlla16]